MSTRVFLMDPELCTSFTKVVTAGIRQYSATLKPIYAEKWGRAGLPQLKIITPLWRSFFIRIFSGRSGVTWGSWGALCRKPPGPRRVGAPEEWFIFWLVSTKWGGDNDVTIFFFCSSAIGAPYQGCPWTHKSHATPLSGRLVSRTIIKFCKTV